MIGAMAFAVIAFAALIRDAQRRRALQPPVIIRRARREPLYGWDAQGQHAGSSYAISRERLQEQYEVLDSSYESIAIDAPPLQVRFLVDNALVYRGQSDLYRAAKVNTSRFAPDLQPYWRSDEPKRLQILLNDDRFARILYDLRSTPDFVALMVASRGDQRIPIGSPARRLHTEGDVIVLTRSGAEVPYRDERDALDDITRLARLRDLLASISIPETLKRGETPGLILTSLSRVLRMIILFFGLIGGGWLLGLLLWKYC